MTLTRDEIFIGGAWAKPHDIDRRLAVISPISEEEIGSVPLAGEQDIDDAVAAARRVHEAGTWSALTVRERGEHLLRIAAELQLNLDDLVQAQIDEMGSPFSFAYRATAGTIAGVAGSIEAAASIPQREVRPGYLGDVLVSRVPIGVVGAVIPWNAPFALVMLKMVPALLTGCPIIVKCAPESPLSAYYVAEAAERAGLPAGLLSIVAADREVSEYLVRHPGVDRVSFTGSTAAGARVASLCGEQLKSATLELGGKSAAVVLDDADFDTIMPSLIESSLPNNGQVCYATTRILAPRSRSRELTDRLVEAVSQLSVGDPHLPDTDVGPLVAARQRDRVERYIEVGRREGATVELGGGRPAGQPTGWFVEPTVFSGATNQMTIAREEIFGPVVCVIDYDDDADAVNLANDSDYGLGGGVFTSDIERGVRVATQINTGTCRINEALAGGGGGPFGGTKKSGLGREASREGFESYYELQAVSLPAGTDASAWV